MNDKMPYGVGYTASWLLEIEAACWSGGGNPDAPFFYLGGPMTDYPQHNFPRFDFAASKLRGLGYNIVSPAELDDPADRKRFMASEDGFVSREEHNRLLSRDLVICSMPMCVGGIFLEGWEASGGANRETFVLDRLGKELLSYEDDGESVRLTQFDRDEALAAARTKPVLVSTREWLSGLVSR